jgi:hypothetical protein
LSIQHLAAALTVAAGICALAVPAGARDIAIDGDTPFPVTGCLLGQACTGQSLPFSIITPAVTTNQIFIYRAGIVSLGSALPLDAAFGDVSTLGSAFLAPGFGNYGTQLPDVYTTVVHPDPTQGSPPHGFRVTWIAADTSIFQLELTDLSFDGPIRTLSKIGDVRADFAYHSNFATWQGRPVLADAVLPSGAFSGYRVGNLSGASTNGVNLTGAPALPSVPEPATWAMLLLGFGVLGSVLRERRRRGLIAVGSGAFAGRTQKGTWLNV